MADTMQPKVNPKSKAINVGDKVICDDDRLLPVDRLGVFIAQTASQMQGRAALQPTAMKSSMEPIVINNRPAVCSVQCAGFGMVLYNCKSHREPIPYATDNEATATLIFSRDIS